ncbi:MAG: NADH dehydrogenase [Minwuia thermotolerans]|nr:MAG: NADH dehydrogenase [Minwuia thermotolerans]
MAELDFVPVAKAPAWLAPVHRRIAQIQDVLGNIGWPVLDLVLRIWIGQTFLLSGLVKVADWESAIFLATHEYPVTWLAPWLAALLGAAIEVVGGAALMLGLATRLVALPMAVLSLVIQSVYLELNVHIFWALFLGWYVVAGAGPIALDRLLGRGFATLPLPLVGTFDRFWQWSDRYLAPLWLVLFRVWIAWIFFASGLTKIDDFGNTILLFQYEYAVPLIPPALAAWLATFFELAAPVAILLGLFCRLATLPLIVMTLVIQFTYLDHADHFWWLAILGLLALRGPGPLALDSLLQRVLVARYPAALQPARWDDDELPHVVVVGAGFGGVAAVQGLKHSPCRITLIDRRNYHLFQPLLYQVATAGLSPADIASPIREIFRDQSNVRVLMGRVSDVDTAERQVLIGDTAIGYDHLVIATGARHAYFGKDAWEQFAPGLKKIPDATEIRGRILGAFEAAEECMDPTERAAWMTFVVVGGGPTGVELAGAIAELAHHGMRGEFRNADPANARVILVQSADRLLPPFPPGLSRRTKESLEKLGVEVRLGCRVTGIDAEGVTVGEERIAARTALWAAGVMASPAARWLGAESDRAGRVKVDANLSVPGHPELFVVGDTAASDGWDGQPVPGLAPAAKQGGAHVARVINARLTRAKAPGAFRYRHAGNLATIGRASAVADLGRLKISGPVAWWFWGVVHVMFLTSKRDQLSVALEWAWAYMTFRRSTRLIDDRHGPDS